MLQPFQGNHTYLRWNREQPRPPVGPLRSIVTLPGAGAVELPDPGGVVVRGIDGHGLVREEGVEGGEAALHKRGRGLIIWEVDPVEEVGAVARVGPDGRPEPLFREVGRDPLRRGQRRVVLGVGRRDPARPDRVDVDREPVPANDVGVGGRGVLSGETQLDPVRSPGEERRVHAVQSDIDPGDRGVGVERLDGPGKGLVVVEVARVRDAVGERPDLDHAAVGGEHVDHALDGVAHPVTPGMRGKSGAEMASPRATRWKLTSGTM